MSPTLSPLLATCLAIGTALAPLPACSQGSASQAKSSFDSERAWKDLEKLVAFGPRPSGSAAIEETRKFLETELRAIGLTPVRETFKQETPVGEIEFVNVYAELEGTKVEGRKTPVLLVGSHYDTKRFDAFKFVGANDAGSSTAVVLELARTLKAGGPRAMTIRFVFFDGEEAVRRDWKDPDNTYGSRYHAAQIEKSADRDRYKALVLLDMVGDKDLHLTPDTYSTKKLRDAFFDAAKAQGLAKSVNGRTQSIKDDHLSFRRINIPSVDLIDLDYGPNNSYWHTVADTLENCSKDSLDKIGRIFLAGLPTVEATYGK